MARVASTSADQPCSALFDASNRSLIPYQRGLDRPRRHLAESTGRVPRMEAARPDLADGGVRRDLRDLGPCPLDRSARGLGWAHSAVVEGEEDWVGELARMKR